MCVYTFTYIFVYLKHILYFSICYWISLPVISVFPVLEVNKDRSPHFLIEEKPSESATLLPGGGREFNYQKTYYAPNTMLHASRSTGTIISRVQMTQFPSSS